MERETSPMMQPVAGFFQEDNPYSKPEDLNMEDNTCYIEKLPEEILVDVLSLLPLRESVATSALSSRWKYLWKKSCRQKSDFTFDAANIIGHCENVHIHTDEYCCHCRGKMNRRYLRKLDDTYLEVPCHMFDVFVKGADTIMQCHYGEEQDVVTGVKSLEINFPLEAKHSNHLDNWISLTVTSVTKCFILILDTISDWLSDDDFYRFPFEILHNQRNLCLEYLELEFMSMTLPEMFNGFTFLRTLKLNSIIITQEDLEKLLINCPFLEILDLRNIWDLHLLRVSSPIPHLRSLIFHGCNNLRSMEIFAENLSDFEYSGDFIRNYLMLGKCTNLTKVALNEDAFMNHEVIRTELSNDFPYLRTLYLNVKFVDLNTALRGCVFNHLKFVALFLSVCRETENELQYLTTFFSAVAPMLEELEFHLFCYATCSKINFEKINGKRYNHLRRVSFTGFTGGTGQMKLAKYFLMEVPTLQTMTIALLVRYYNNFDAVTLKDDKASLSEINRCRNAYNLLCPKVPENVKLVLFES